MEYDNIKILLQKYWACETSEAEEKYLRDFFTNAPTVPDELIAERDLFIFYTREANYPTLNQDLTAKFEKEVKGRIISFPSLFKYAAVLVLLFIATYVFFENKPKSSQYSVIEPTIHSEQAIKEANVALSMLGENIKDGLYNVKQLEVLENLKKDFTKKRNKKN